MNFIKNAMSNLLDDQATFTDLTQVAVVDAEACLSVLCHRHARGSVYTHCGPMLVAVNPYHEIPELYTPDVLERHLRLAPSEEPPAPHVYGTAAKAYSRAMSSGTDQAIVISGESGSGKTETARHIVGFLADAACSAQDSLHSRVIGANPITEAFGCAQTVRNHNSSRFGKFVMLHFERSGRLAGAGLQTYLLEKSRVVDVAPGETNFHAFYLVCAGQPSSQLSAYGLPAGVPAVRHFAYLRPKVAPLVRDAAHDRERFGQLVAALGASGIDETQQIEIWRVMLGILHLGNIGFGQADEAATEGRPEVAALEAACMLLGAPVDQLRDAMCKRRFKAGTEWVNTVNTPAQAAEVRSGLAKHLYASLFSWLVETVNGSLGAPAGGQLAGPRIGCVDIFGFEDLKTNSLEQLCINFANEKLHRLFVGSLFEAAVVMYAREGVQVEATPYADNQPVVDLIGGKPTSLMAMLTEECVFPKGLDVLFLQKVVRAHGKHDHFVEQKTSPTTFGIRHYAGDVVYSATGFLSKNKDPLCHDLLVLLQRASNPFIAALMQRPTEAAAAQAAAVAASGAGAGGANRKFRSSKFCGVVDSFQLSLRALVATLQAGEIHFVRCIKPNDSQAPQNWDKSVAARQLKCSGIVSAVHASRAAFSDHLPPRQIASQFGGIAEGGEHLAHAGRSAGDEFALAEAVLASCGIPKNAYAVGRTRIFLRSGVLDELERLRLGFVEARVVAVQSSVRGMAARRRVAQIAAQEQQRLEEDRQRAEAQRRAAQAQAEQQRREAAAREAREAEEQAERREKYRAARVLSFERKKKKDKPVEQTAEAPIAESPAEMKRRLSEIRLAETEARHTERLASEGFCLTLPQSTSHELSPQPWLAGASPTDVKKAQLDAPPPTVPRREFACPQDDVLAYARYLGMDVDADADLLWIADEALQATEPYGWEERLDPAGGRYFHNTITQMTIVQHPVDYHYQQLYLQMKRERAARNRRGACAELPAPSPMGRTPSYVLDLRSVSADDTGGSSPSTPKGWLNRAKTLVTPRGRPAKPVETVRFTVNIRRAPSERLGVELDGRNQIIAILAGSPCARCQDIHVQDRIVTVDGQELGDRQLADVISPSEEHSFVLERCLIKPVSGGGIGGLRSLMTPRSQSPRSSHNSPSKLSARRKDALPLESPTTKWERFQTVIDRGACGLGVVCDESGYMGARAYAHTLLHRDGGAVAREGDITAGEEAGVSLVVDMVPGSSADAQRAHETAVEPRMQIGDRVVCVDGEALNGRGLEEVIRPAATHTFLLERAKKPTASLFSKALRVLTPRCNDSDEAPAPSRALREVVLHKVDRDTKLGIRFVRYDEGFDRDFLTSDEVVQPIVAALDPLGMASVRGIQVNDLVLSINGQTGLSNTQVAAVLRDSVGPIVLVLRRATHEDNSGMLTARGSTSARGSFTSRGRESTSSSPGGSPAMGTPRSSARRLV